MSATQARQQSMQSDTLPLTESQAKQWVATLPLADAGVTTKRLFNVLRELNRNALPPLARIRIAEIMRPAMDMTLSNLQRHLSYQAFPLPEKSQKIYELSQALTLEFSGAYQLAALDMLTQNNITKKALAVAAYRGIDYMGQVLLIGYAMYVRTRDAVWHDIHQLYLMASEHQVEGVAIPAARAHAPNLNARYIQINMLALCKPYSLRQEEVFRVERFLQQTYTLVEIQREPHDLEKEYVHVAVLNTDEAAVIMPLGDLPHSPTVRVFHLDALMAQLQARIDTQEEGEVQSVMQKGLSHNLAQRLHFHLTTVRNRSFNRVPRDEDIGMVVRLPEILKALQCNDVDQAQQRHEEDLLFSALTFGEALEGDYTQSSTVQKGTDGISMQIWHVMNNSLRGYGLNWRHSEASSARVGELIGLRSLGKEDVPWMIGVIKWMETMKDKGLCCGVELLSADALPISITELASRELTQSLPIEGLLLPKVNGVRPEPVLILPSYIFRSGDQVRLHTKKQHEWYALTRLNEHLGSFAQFHFESINEPAQVLSDEFESLWDTL